jgi:hypothetical protein
METNEKNANLKLFVVITGPKDDLQMEKLNERGIIELEYAW